MSANLTFGYSWFGTRQLVLIMASKGLFCHKVQNEEKDPRILFLVADSP